MSGQSIMDRVAAAKHSIAGQGLAKSVCKATTEEIIGPKKKHLDYLLQCTNEPNVSIPQLADLLIERTQHSNWVVVFKSLITIHNLMNYGNERFTQYLASNNCSFNLGSFVDKAGVQGYDMSTFIRRYAKYLNEKAISYRGMAFDFCKVKRGKDDGLLRTMNAEKLLKSLPVLQQQLDALLEFDCTPNELTNGVINACFMLLFKDLIRLFACYNDGIINLLEKYFDMNKKQCKDALDLYKKFLVRMEKVSEFLKVAENVGIDKGDIPDLAKGLKDKTSSAPASLLEALEQHLASLEGKKGATTPATSSAKPAGFTSALSTMSTNSSALAISETEKKKILEEESRQLQQLKASDSEPTPEADLLQEQAPESDDTNVEQRLKELKDSPSASQAASNPFGSQPPAPSATSAASAAARPSDDLLGLNNNPFSDNIQSVMATAYSTQPAAPMSNNPFGAPPFQQTNGFAGSAAGSGSGFTSDADFARAFNSTATGSSAALNFSTATVPATNQAPPALDLGSPLDPLDPNVPQHTGAGQAEAQTQPPAPASGLAADLFGGTQSQPPAPSQAVAPTSLGTQEGGVGSMAPTALSASPSQPTAIPGAFSGLDAGLLGPARPTSPSLGTMGAPGAFGGVGLGPSALSTSPSQPMAIPGAFGAPEGTGVAPSALSTSPSQPMAIPGAFAGLGGPGLGMSGLSSSPAGPSVLSSSPMGGGMGPLGSQPMGMGTQPFGQLGMGAGPGAMGLSASPKGPGLADLQVPGSPARMARTSRSPSPTMPDTGSFGRTSPSVAMGGDMPPASASSSGFDAFGDVLQPMNKGGGMQGPGLSKADQPKLMAKDLDSSLASLASNLSVNTPSDQIKKTQHQWQPKGESKLTGGTTYQQRPMISTATTWNMPQQQPQQPYQPPMMGAPGMGYGQPQMAGAMGAQPMMGMGQPMMMPGMGAMPAMGMQPQPGMMYGGGMRMPAAGMPQQQPPAQNPSQDPFGAL